MADFEHGGRQAKRQPAEGVGTEPPLENEQVEATTQETLAKVKAVPGSLTPANAMALQRLAGNRALATLVRPLSVQRHSVASAPPPPEFEGDPELAAVQPLPLQRFDDGIPRVQRWGLAGLAGWIGSMIGTKSATKMAAAGLDMKKVPAKTPPVVKKSPGKTPPAVKKDPAKAPPAPDIPKLGADVKVVFSEPEVVGDGASTVTAKAVGGTVPDGALWKMAGTAYGSSIDAKSGVLTGGSGLAAAETAPLKVNLETAGGVASGQVELVRKDVYQARKDVKKFVQEGPFNTVGGELRGRHGKWDGSYDPAAKLLSVRVPMRVTFPDDLDLPTDTKEQKEARSTAHKQYVDTFISQVQNRWSGKFKIKNVREPASVWSLISPVAVSVAPLQVPEGQPAYFNVKSFLKTAGTAAVGRERAADGYAADSDQRRAHLFADTIQPKTSAFMAGIRTDELARLRAVAPHVFASQSGGVQAASKPTLDFLGQYLRALHRPEFVIEAIGRDHRSATRAKTRAKVVIDHLGGLGPHETKASGVVEAGISGADSHKVALSPAYKDPNFTVNYDIAAHEFGHMLGLPDEYANDTQAVGAQLGTHDLMKRAFGDKYADAFGKVTADSASVMHSGDDLQIHHYLYFWDALINLSQKASAPTPKFGDADWKLYEG